MPYTYNIVNIDREKLDGYLKEWDMQRVMDWVAINKIRLDPVELISKNQISELISVLRHQQLTLNLALPCVEKEKNETLSNNRLIQLNKILSEMHTSIAWCQQSIENLEKLVNG